MSPVRDLPRNANGSAVLVEGRNDENQIIAQLHTAFLLAHNAFVDKGLSFAQAQRRLILYYQRALVDDYLPHVVGPATDSAEATRLVRTGMTPSNVLAYRNMIRAKFYDMPSGQTVARRMGFPVLTDAQLHLPPAVAPAFQTGVPLWYYILAESSVREGGRRLGPVGSRIVNDMFTATLQRDPDSIVRGNAGFQPAVAIAGPDRTVQFSDLLVFAGVATAPN